MKDAYAVPTSSELALAKKRKKSRSGRNYKVIEDSKESYIAEIDPHETEPENAYLAGFGGLGPIIPNLSEIISEKGLEVKLVRSDESCHSSLNAAYFIIANGLNAHDINNSLMARISGNNSSTRLTLTARGSSKNLPILRSVIQAYGRQL